MRPKGRIHSQSKSFNNLVLNRFGEMGGVHPQKRPRKNYFKTNKKRHRFEIAVTHIVKVEQGTLEPNAGNLSLDNGVRKCRKGGLSLIPWRNVEPKRGAI